MLKILEFKLKKHDINITDGNMLVKVMPIDARDWKLITGKLCK